MLGDKLRDYLITWLLELRLWIKLVFLFGIPIFRFWRSEIMAISKFTTAVQAAKAIKSMLPDSVFENIKKYVDTQVQSVIEKMNLVSREEYEAQDKQLRQLREKIETLEQSAANPQRQTKTKT